MFYSNFGLRNSTAHSLQLTEDVVGRYRRSDEDAISAEERAAGFNSSIKIDFRNAKLPNRCQIFFFNSHLRLFRKYILLSSFCSGRIWKNKKSLP